MSHIFTPHNGEMRKEIDMIKESAIIIIQIVNINVKENAPLDMIISSGKATAHSKKI